MVKFTHHISHPLWEYRQQENRGGQRGGTGLWFLPLSSVPFLPSLPSSHPVCAPLTPSLLPSLPSQIHRKALISAEEEVDRRGPLATLTQLVRLIKRVCGLWVRAQTHQETVKPTTPLCYRNILRSNNLHCFAQEFRVLKKENFWPSASS